MSRQHRRHDFIGTLAVGKLDFNALFFKEAQVDGRVLGGVEHRVGHLADCDLGQRGFGFRGLLGTSHHGRAYKGGCQQHCQRFFELFQLQNSLRLESAQVADSFGYIFFKDYHRLVEDGGHHCQNNDAGHHKIQLEHLPAVDDQVPQPRFGD